MKTLLSLCVTFGILTSCAPSTEAERLFRQAETMARRGHFEEAFATLGRSLEAEYPTPSDVVSDPSFTALLDDPAWRPKVLKVLQSHPRESSITMAYPNATGEPLVLTVHVVGGVNEPPQPATPPILREGVMITLVHVDAAGYYQEWTPNEDWNPRHFGVAQTDDTGTVVARTILPGYYGAKYEAPDEPRHIHYNVEYNGALLRASEFYFDDDPRLVGDVRREAERNRVPIATVKRDDAGMLHAEVTIPVRGLR